jgi:hypothetical protein
MENIVQFGFAWLAAITIIVLAVRCAALARTCRKLTGILYRQSAENGFYRKQVSDDLEIIGDLQTERTRLEKGALSWIHEYTRLIKDIREKHPDFQPPFINLKSNPDGSK